MYEISVSKERTNIKEYKENFQRQIHGYAQELKLWLTEGSADLSYLGLSKNYMWGQAKGSWAITAQNPTYTLDEDSIKCKIEKKKSVPIEYCLEQLKISWLCTNMRGWIPSMIQQSLLQEVNIKCCLSCWDTCNSWKAQAKKKKKEKTLLKYRPSAQTQSFMANKLALQLFSQLLKNIPENNPTLVSTSWHNS